MIKKLLLKMIKSYQNIKHTFFKHKKGICKFTPTCSEYSYQAINKYGAFKGTLLAIWRILRCNPFSKGGYDPLK
ncbi:MAG: membrane protein insertion efficiency factor YidD [Clostridia bacterium]|nr:membrane protein insertion efficiency factor YidD [Clostridia bacterium]